MKDSTSKWLAAIVVLQVILLMAVWGIPSISTAHAEGIPDAGAQQQEIINQIKATNEKLDKLVTLLSGGHLQVNVVKADDSKGHD